MSTVIKVVLLIKHLPVSQVDRLPPRFIDRWKHLSNVGIEHLKDNRQGLLLACEAAEVFWFRELHRGTQAEPFATKSLFGWVFRGPFSEVNE